LFNVQIKYLNIKLWKQKVTKRNLGIVPTGAHDFVMGTEAMENGIYIIIVNSGSSAFADKVRVIR
jgi:hypothetical protein